MSCGDNTTVDQDTTIVRLRHGLRAVYHFDTDVQQIAIRRLKRGRQLTDEQRVAYRSWLDEQRQDAS